jgi:hypothetical protein
MPGLATRQKARAGDGMRNFQQIIFGSALDDDFFATALTGAPLTSLAAASLLTLTRTGMPLPRSVTAKLVTDGTVATRGVVLRFYGWNYFGEQIFDDITLTAVASTTHAQTTDKVFAKVDRIEVISISNMKAGDNLKVGLDVVATGLLATDIIYGLSEKCLAASDILGGVGVFSGATITGFTGSDVTFIPDEHGVQLSSAFAPNGTNNRVVFLTCRTSW